MGDWHHRKGIGLLARVAGLCLIGFAWVAISKAYGLTHGVHPTPDIYLLAAIAFLCASGGAALAVLGRHVFDRIQLAARWRPRYLPPSNDDAGMEAHRR